MAMGLAPGIAAPVAAAQSDRLDLRFVAAAVRRRWRLALGIFGVVVLVTFLLVARQPYVYSATAEVVLNTREERIAPASTQAEAALPNAERADTEVAVLKSRELAEAVATALQLERDPAFNAGATSSPRALDRLRGLIGVGRGVVARALTPADIRRAIVDQLQAGLTVARSDQTFVLDITYRAASGADAARIANEFARQYTAGQIQRQAAGSRTATAFLAARLETLRVQAQSDAERVQRYRLAHNLPSTSGASLTEQEISSYNQAVTVARAQAAEDVARLDTARAQVRSGSNGGDAGEALGSPVVGGLRAREAEVSGRLTALTARYGPQYPDVAKARSELTDVQAQIAAEIARILSNLQARAQISRQRLASLEGSLAAARGTLADSNRALAGLNDLDRRAAASQALYESYLNRYKEIVAQSGTERADARLLSRAEVPLVPSSPRVVLSVALAAIVGAALGLVAAVVAEALFTGLTTPDDVERRLGRPCLGEIPAAPADDAADPASDVAESYRGLVATLRQAAGAVPAVIAVTSAAADDGAAAAAAALARTLAQAGATTALAVDADAAARPEAAGSFTLVPIAGLRQSARPLEVQLADLRRRFDHVVVAAPPLLAAAESRSLAALAEVTVVVVGWRSTPDRTVRAALRLLAAATLPVTGILLAGVRRARR